MSKYPEWSRHLRSRLVDLVGDYAGRELFIVDGDSLLHRAFSDPNLDFPGPQNSSSFAGIQLAHLIANVETFILDLRVRRCNFDICFFDDHLPLSCGQNADAGYVARRFARAIVIRHVGGLRTKERLETEDSANDSLDTTDASPVSLSQFDGFHDASFQTYLTKTKPYFVLCSEGTVPSKDIEIQCYHAFIALMMSRGINVASLEDVRFQDSKVITFVYEIAPKTSRQFAEMSSSGVLGVVPANSTDMSNLDLPFEAADNLLSNSELSERNMIAILSLSAYLLRHPQPNENHLMLCRLYLVHIALLSVLPLCHRAQASPGHLPNPLVSRSGWVSQFLFDVLTEAEAVVTCFDKMVGNDERDRDCADCVDGRLFWRVFVEMHVSQEESVDKLLGPKVWNEFQRLWNALAAMTFIEGMSLDNTTNIDDFRFAPIPQTQSLYQSTDRTTKTYQILPFSHPYLDRYLPTLDNQLVTIAPEDLTQIHGPTGVTHREHRHWHNKREITATPSTSSLTSRQKMKLLRAEQKYHSQLQKYAASLTGANGRGLTPVVVPEVKAGSKQKSAKEKSVSEKSEKGGKKAGKEKAGKGLSKADQIRANNTADKAKKVEKKSIDLWKSQYKELEKMENPHAALNHLETLLSKDSTDPAIRMELNLAKFSILVSLAKSDEDCAKLLYFTTPLLQSSDLSSESCTFLYKGLKQLNLHNCIDKVDIKSLQSRDFVVKLKPPTARTTILDSSTRFQLLHGGPFMQRSVDSKKDGRVGFEPDPWQVEVLDILDKDESLIVCAPTSAGKTFIAFYAMEKVLRGSNDGVIVYVAPTKALVNQIAAEIHARFSKAYSTGWSMWAIHTRDYRVHNPLTCQVLVTVPAILQIMLLSPHNAEWRSRVKRVILDEVHCIGEMEGGSVWEQLLLLSTSSIIALSATIGNPNEFHQWLESIQKVQNRKLHLVEHKQRYSDLRKFVYIPSTTSKTLKSLDFSSKSSALSFVHPVAAVDPEASSLPKELSLEARDCLLLYDAMRKVALPQDLRKLDKLDPETYFAKIPHIRKPDCLKYERKLKEVLAGWIGGDKGRFSGVIQELRKGVVEEMDALEVNWKDGQDVYGQQFWLDTVTDLTGDLRGQGLLPAIYFHYDRTGCNKLAERLFNDLESAEKEFRRTDRAWLAKVEEYEEWIAGAKERAKARERREKAKGKKGGEAEDVGEDDDESGGPANPYRADPAFSLAGEKTGYTLTELEEAIVQLKPVMSGQMFLLQALRRGIAVHHAGCNKRYLQLVEMLFRRKFLSVVIATGTLALGINMPCKTVVFVGDSVYLTVLNYRQGSGRAGRRGFDLLGNVVFHGCTLSKVFRLMQARLPDITGHFPLTTTLTLRLLQLFTELQNYKGKNREKYLEQSRAMVASLFEQPFLYVGGHRFRDQIQHHLRFSIEYLRREGLIDADGAPLDMAGLTSHLFYIEPANFAFGALFRGGIFHRVCKTIDSNRQGTLHALMHILCHLFGRLERKPSTKESALERIKNSPSRVILEPLPEYAARVLRKHDDRVLETYTAYISSYVCQFRDRLGVDNRLPLSGKVVGADSKGAESEDEGSLVRKLGETAIPLLARSTFSALSGWGDEFRSVEDLTASVRNGVFLEVSAIPTMSKLVSRPVSEPAVLDAYLLDFFNHGQVEALIRGNGIRRGDIWFLLDAFHYNLRSITVGLEVWLKKLDHEAADELDGGEVDDWEDDDDSGIGESISTKKSDAVDDDTWKVYRAFKLLEQEFMEKFKKMWA